MIQYGRFFGSPEELQITGISIELEKVMVFCLTFVAPIDFAVASQYLHQYNVNVRTSLPMETFLVNFITVSSCMSS